VSFVAAVFGCFLGFELTVYAEDGVLSDGLIDQGRQLVFFVAGEALVGEVEHFVCCGYEGLVGLGRVIEDEGLALGAKATKPLDVALGGDFGSGFELWVCAVEQGPAGSGEIGFIRNFDGFGIGVVAQKENFVADGDTMECAPNDKERQYENEYDVEFSAGTKSCHW